MQVGAHVPPPLLSLPSFLCEAQAEARAPSANLSFFFCVPRLGSFPHPPRPPFTDCWSCMRDGYSTSNWWRQAALPLYCSRDGSGVRTWSASMPVKVVPLPAPWFLHRRWTSACIRCWGVASRSTYGTGL
ncbi:hypothetical protein MAPG_06214 [Magnaporthiopsis poae ATCC 64411]|uniref:Uncharacterized protein n=1 Tax=Magnaporthiopsis poae (strain ATCC 64411 / 73-15) TaxID=644358 RepID=A0A0C4E1F4_MAGP6|nr:hypothetical protein MAPG_06214 [Magnaporthiopsis poae ATCC 64411]